MMHNNLKFGFKYFFPAFGVLAVVLGLFQAAVFDVTSGVILAGIGALIFWGSRKIASKYF
ncbi:hypothetical protein D3C83_283900 [compost metagenome]